MSLLTCLRWSNGIVITAALCACCIAAFIQWSGRFVRGAAQTGWNVARLFTSGFQKYGPSAEDPYVDLSLWLTGLVLMVLWISVFLPRVALWMHLSAAGAGALLLWYLWPSRFDPWPVAVLLHWFVYYWAVFRHP